MADTIVNNTPSSPPQDNGSAGWAVAVIILLAVIVGGFMWYRYHRVYVPVQQQPAANINVTIPNPSGGNSGGGTTNTTNQ